MSTTNRCWWDNNRWLYSLPMSTLGERIKEVRNELGYSQKELGILVNVTQQNIAKLENNKAKGTYLIAALSDALQVNTEWLLTGEGPKNEADVDFDSLTDDDQVKAILDELSKLNEKDAAVVLRIAEALNLSS